MSDSHRQTCVVPTAKVREWLVWFGEQSTQDPKNTEIRRLSNRLYNYCQRAGAPGSTLGMRGTPAATSAKGSGDLPGFDWTSGEISFTFIARPASGRKRLTD